MDIVILLSNKYQSTKINALTIYTHYYNLNISKTLLTNSKY